MAVTAETRTHLLGLSVVMGGAAPGTDLLNEWVLAVQGGMSVADIANHIASSDAFQAAYPAFLTTEEFANSFLSNIGGGELTAAGLNDGVVIAVGLLNGGMTRGELALLALERLLDINAQGEDHPAHGDFGAAGAALYNQIMVAEYHTVDSRIAEHSSAVLEGVTSDPATVKAAIDALAAVGETFVLTTGIDDIQGTDGDDLIIAQSATSAGTLTSLDRIDGGEGYDTLEVTYAGGGIGNVAEASILSVEELALRTTGAISSTRTETKLVEAGGKDLEGLADFSGWGVETIRIENVGDGEHVGINASGAALTNALESGGYEGLGGQVSISDASSVRLGGVSPNSLVLIDTKASTESVSIAGGGRVVIAKLPSALSEEGNTAGTTLKQVSVTGVSKATRIVSNVIERVEISKQTKPVTIVNDSKDKGGQLTVAVDGFGAVTKAGVDRAELRLLGETGAIGTLNLEVAGDSYVSLVGPSADSVDSLKTLNISGSAMLELMGPNADNLETVKVSGDVDLDVDLVGNTKLKTYDGGMGGGSQEVNVASSGVLASVTTGSGNDIVHLGGETTVRGGVSVDLGAGDDEFSSAEAGSVNAASSISGGAGDGDVLHVNAAVADVGPTNRVTGVKTSIFSGFEILRPRVEGAEGAEGAFDLGFHGIRNVELTGSVTGNVELNNAMAGTELNVSGDLSDHEITYNQKGAGVEGNDADSVTVNLHAVGGRADKAASAAAGPVTSGEAKSQLTAGDIETIVINSGATPGGTASVGDYTNEIKVSGNAVTTLDINGDAMVKVMAQGATSKLKTVDARGNDAGVEVRLDSFANKGPISFHGGDGKDTFNASRGKDVIYGNGGDDSVKGRDGNDVITGGAGADMLSGGNGEDRFRYEKASDSRLSFDSKGVNPTGFDRITDFRPGEDAIVLTRALGVTDSDLNGQGAILDKGEIESLNGKYVAAAASDFFSDGADDHMIAAAQWGDGTLIFIDINENGNLDLASDMVIHISTATVEEGWFDII